MFCGGHDFLPDGRAFVCTLHGDVWLVDGIDQKLGQITWRRFATGLFQPLGVKLVAGSKGRNSSAAGMDLFVVGRDQITRLHDLNGDGEADFYENFNNDATVSLAGHEYVTSIETDRAGNLYYIKGNCNSEIPHDGSLLRVSPDGQKLEVFATGFRNSNGIGIGPNDEITVAPQEGEWTPGSAVFDVQQGGFYGAMMSHHRSPAPTDFQRPFCWFPRLADNSSGGQVWVPEGLWGPLSGHLLHTSFGQCELRLLLREPLPADISTLALRRSTLVTMNGGSTELPMTFTSGIHRGRFNKQDGHLYLTGLKGWVTSAVNDGCFQRVRYTGRPVDLLTEMKTYHNGVALTFSRPLNRDDVVQIDNYQLEAWNYHWSSAYGSPDLRPSAPGQIGRDPIEPSSVTLLDDHRTIFIELPDLQPVDQLGISYSLHAADGAGIENTAYLTINGVPTEAMPESRLHRSQSDRDRSELLSRLSSGVTITAPFLAAPVQRRMMAWADWQLTGSPPTDSKVTAAAYLKIPTTGEYRFSAISDSPAELDIEGKQFALGDRDVTIPLQKGLVKIGVQQVVTQQSSRFRLMWESHRFPREAIPAGSLFHEAINNEQTDSQQLLAEGTALFARYKCGQCHVGEPAQSKNPLSAASFEYQRHAPELLGIGSRLNPDWLAAWLRTPTHLRPDAVMGAVPELRDDRALADLIAYLTSLSDSPKPDQASQAAPQSLAKKGEELYERLGCIACHTLAARDDHSEWNRISLHYVNGKFQSGQLERFLRGPHQHHLGSRMPDFRLSSDEAQALTSYLSENSKGTLPRFTEAKQGDAKRGKALFVELRCDRCHQATPADKKGQPNVHSVLGLDAKSGCLRVEDSSANKSPTFNFTEREREALRAYLKAPPSQVSITQQANEAVLPHMLTRLRCTACHARDTSSATWPEVVAEEGSGKLPESVPQLTWVGEKLQGPWVAKLIKGEQHQKTRPWLTARMPGFPEYANQIAQAMANEHGVLFCEPVPNELDQRQIGLGHRLTLRDGGLDCRQCHGLGKELPRGDTATQIALGINFAMVRDRLRPEFAQRQLLDPPRYDIGSRMPRFAPDLRTTPFKQIEAGDARKQFEAIEQYLWSIKTEE